MTKSVSLKTWVTYSCIRPHNLSNGFYFVIAILTKKRHGAKKQFGWHLGARFTSTHLIGSFSAILDPFSSSIETSVWYVRFASVISRNQCNGVGHRPLWTKCVRDVQNKHPRNSGSDDNLSPYDLLVFPRFWVVLWNEVELVRFIYSWFYDT